MDVATKDRYQEKLSIINGYNPYDFDAKDASANPDDFPRCNLWCIGNYLVFKTSHYTQKDFNAYKSLGAYNQFSCGWVRDVYVKVINDWHVVVGKVLHSMRVSEKPLHVWIIAGKEGEVNSAHCTCMAGLAEACSHIAAVLFYIESHTRFVQEKSVTEVAAYWAPPTAIKRVSMEPIEKIDFSKKALCKKKETKTLKKQYGTEVSDKEYKDCLQKLSKVETTNPVAILTAETPFCNKYINPRTKDLMTVCQKVGEKYPLKMRDLFREELQAKGMDEILAISETLSFEASPEQCRALEKDTRQQSKCKLWFQYRAGRITASMMKRVTTASLDKPPLSLVKTIVYPERNRFVTRATEWGCTHEETGRQHYLKVNKLHHAGLNVSSAGLFVSCNIPHVGATPDGIVDCVCCGKGCLEIKCPYCLRDSSNEELAEKANFLDSTTKKLKKNHMYYFQCQTHMLVTELKYCDFVIWTKSGVYIERILPSSTWVDDVLPKVNSFFRRILLPELLAKKFSLQPSKSPTIIKLSKN